MEICAPFAGIVRYHVAEGDTVDAGAPVATVEATKLEIPVVSPAPGIVSRVLVPDFSTVAGGDRLAEIGERP
ncbi:acetyl-CoA carboxylase biotin carboxyl carrier protein subunit [Corynebacterium sp. 32222D000AT]|uniref:acetyl-CoA carboxylase biotin carboxyl carrier protein subunit n=1 Tax=unclassified Corynebacterium TaxID=2624378 RepID=UPI0026011AB1|nr:acetyl-CoA carboxylase biotin carboxyl carrier protein subunit [uncultured Corynebacterium sp.]MDD7581311.1 acetyl-CoA carboxylase biotin carboxyl carrier protein subunit [Mycobacteriaceae bacterium]MDY5830157.1 acetyl-CoA carboxylase biotin carboxyl carrier protein subunit [Corynebacterium sp.]